MYILLLLCIHSCVAWLSILAHTNLQRPGVTVKDVLETHYREYGRNYFTRYDYEEVDSDGANRMIAHLHTQLPSLVGTSLNGFQVSVADDFSYTDPIDGSISTKQVSHRWYINSRVFVSCFRMDRVLCFVYLARDRLVRRSDCMSKSLVCLTGIWTRKKLSAPSSMPH
jgi:hypothetical protein